MINKGLFSLLLAYILNSPCCAQNLEHFTCDATAEKPCIVQDTDNRFATVQVLRDALQISDYYQGNLTGVSELFVSLSAEPSETGWQQVANYIKTRTGHNPQDVLVLDLRQESHGYLNGNAITLCDLHNWLNIGKTAEESIATETQWLARLSSLTKIENILSTQQFSKHEYTTGNTVDVENLQSEKDLVTKLGFAYRRLTITDHRAPLDKEVDSFVSLMKKLPNSMWIHLHCRGGKGRSTTFLAMYDMFKNADKVTFDDIIARQASVPPYYNLAQIVRTDPDLTVYYVHRLAFLKQFYLYAQDRLAGYPGKWSQWKEEHQPPA